MEMAGRRLGQDWEWLEWPTIDTTDSNVSHGFYYIHVTPHSVKDVVNAGRRIQSVGM
jgi:hypothetical protein